jgi:hypothetical protein
MSRGENRRREILTMLPHDSVGAEIGVWQGDFSAELIHALNPRRLHLIDPWVMRDDGIHRAAWYGSDNRPDMEAIYAGVMRRFEAEREKGTVVIHRETSKEALQKLPDESLDFIYIDGDHEFSAVREDCFLGYDKVRPGGLLCGDDYALGRWWGDGVVRAFHDLVHARNVIIRSVRGSQIVVEKLAERTPRRR